MGPEGLMQVLHHLSHTLDKVQDPNLLVGLEVADDATVYRVSDQQAVVLTVDFFAPVVDDPYAYGAVAAANAMSDVYAMGGDPVLALNLAAFPHEFPPEIAAEIVRGGADKVAEAGAMVAGGHTIYDEEPKYGLCVMGLVHPERVLTKQGAQPGDLLYLTKRLGTGIIVTTAKEGSPAPEHFQGALESMLQLNRGAAQVVRQVGVHALTDITGFGLLGHAYEVAQASGVGVRIYAEAVPVLDGALAYARAGIHTGGEERNRNYLRDKVTYANGIDPDQESMLYDPQTSGGLLIVLPRERAEALEREFAEAGLNLWRVGEVVEGSGIVVSR